MSDIVTMAAIGMALIFALCQVFLSLRPSFIWGLIMPVMFAAVWLYFGAGPGIIPIVNLELNEAAMSFYTRLGQFGLLIGLALLLFCRLGLATSRRAKIKRREQRRAAKTERDSRERALAGKAPSYMTAGIRAENTTEIKREKK